MEFASLPPVFVTSFSESCMPDEVLTFIWVSDTHIKHDEPARNGYLNQVVQDANQVRPAFVIHTGDCIESGSGEDRELSLVERDIFIGIWDQIDEDIYRDISVGNRDVASNYPLVESDWVEALGYQNRQENAGSKLNATFRIHNTRVFVCNVYGENYTVATLLQWIRGVLAGDRQLKTILLFSHLNINIPTLEGILIDLGLSGVTAYMLHGHNHSGDPELVYESVSTALKVYRIADTYSSMRRYAVAKLPILSAIEFAPVIL